MAHGCRALGDGRPRLEWLAVIVTVLALSLSASAIASSGGAGTGGTPPSGRPSGGNPFGGRGMWIWLLSSTNRGSVPSIVAQAKRYGVRTVMIKSSDGVSPWTQFNRPLVTALHAGGLRVCAWQYVYGVHPILEAQVGAAAVKDGADCLLIDAESQYEGKYVQAQTYVRKLRSLIGQRFPLALAGFPYIDFHPAFPYSVFLGPGRRPIQRPADVLEGHRHDRRRRLRPHLRLQPPVRATDLPARAGLQQSSRPADPALPDGLTRVRGERRQLVGLAGSAAGGVAGGRAITGLARRLHAIDAGRDPGHGRSGRRRRLGSGAPAQPRASRSPSTAASVPRHRLRSRRSRRPMGSSRPGSSTLQRGRRCCAMRPLASPGWCASTSCRRPPPPRA